MDRRFKLLRQRCEARARQLHLPVPFDLERFCDAVAAERGRPIVLRPMHRDDGPAGLWLASDTTDYIYYEQATSLLHRRHIVLHELSHLLCGHHPTSLDGVPLSKDLFATLPQALIERLLQRSTYSTEEEREAELLATLLLGRIARDNRELGLPEDPRTREIQRRLIDSLEDEGERLR